MFSKEAFDGIMLLTIMSAGRYQAKISAKVLQCLFNKGELGSKYIKQHKYIFIFTL